ncbi:DNA polymerase III subunit delta [Labrys monachus]|uniref:DNA polymerase III subunit delta n=1 Tax=Labrys monachus TaxID=217067 RepID=A0ABU0FD15_9HYPH|nr:DNA polymerase III subunit delta [Labrys monachus]MDQ0392421.1 DNA polymerase-3 subunit delta [Labrys monachus]
MTTIERRSVDAFVRKPDAHFVVILVYGPDTGLVSERVRALVAASVDDAEDPFQLVRLDGDEVSGDPARLADEAFTIPLFGGRRAVRLRAGSRNLVPALEPILADPPPACRVVIEAGDLKKSNPLVSLVEKSRAGAAIACFSDESGNIGQIIAEEVASAGLTIAPEARDMLAGLLGGDRLATRSELRKLTLYAHGAGRIEPQDVEAVVGDASALVTDEIIDAAFSGRTEALDAILAKAWSEGVNASVLAGTALRHALLLHRLRGEVEKGRPAAGVVDSAGGQIYFRRKAGVTAQLTALGMERLDRIVAELSDAVLEARRNAMLAEALVSRALMRIALVARARRR